MTSTTGGDAPRHPVRTRRLSFNLNQYPMGDLRVRQAIAHAINRAKLALALGDGFEAGSTLVPPKFTGHHAGAGLAHDASLARKLL